MDSKEKITELDGVRGIAILLVLIWHYFAVPVKVEFGSFLYYLKYMSALTWSGVDLFFVLSGFLIGGILLDNWNKKQYFRTFFIRRICRIFPLYFLLILIVFGLSGTVTNVPDRLFNDPYPLWSYMMFVQNYYMGGGGFGSHWLGVTWSLGIEEQFYLFLPLFIFVVRNRWLAGLLIMMIISAPILRYLVDGLGSYIYTYCRTDSLMSGVLLAWLVRQNGFMEKSRQYRHFLIAGFLGLLSVTAYLTYLITQTGDVINHFVFALMFALLILIALVYKGATQAGILRNSALVWLGTRSYGIYLLHQGIKATLFAVNGRYPPSISGGEEAFIMLAALVMTFVLAELSFRFYESPFIRLGHQFDYSTGKRNKTAIAFN